MELFGSCPMPWFVIPSITKSVSQKVESQWEIKVQGVINNPMKRYRSGVVTPDLSPF